MSFAPITFNITATIPAYLIVKMGSAGNTIAHAAAATDKLIGITADDTKNLTDGCPVIVSGIAKLQFNDTCAIGAFVTSDASGFGVPVVVNTAGVYTIGVLVGNAVSATGTIAEVLLQPGQLSIP